MASAVTLSDKDRRPCTVFVAINRAFDHADVIGTLYGTQCANVWLFCLEVVSILWASCGEQL